jgi:5-methylcytosine-specific restriction enzyme subunit McrC
VTYEDYSVDIEENRLLKAALRRLSIMQLRSPNLHRRVREALLYFELVSDVRYNENRLPTILKTRLNARYRESLALARLILQNSSPEMFAGSESPPGFFVDMNKVFEDFVYAAVGDALRSSASADERWLQGKPLHLDEDGAVKPEPDLSLWSGNRCLFVGDAKYKSTSSGEIDDLYQLLAYCSASGLGMGLLIYANKAHGSRIHHVRHGGPKLHVEGLPLDHPNSVLLARCAQIASLVRTMSSAARTPQVAA